MMEWGTIIMKIEMAGYQFFVQQKTNKFITKTSEKAQTPKKREKRKKNSVLAATEQ